MQKMRPPDGRSKPSSKQITKTCRKCQKQLPTACKTCSCGFSFRKLSPPVTLEDEEQTSVKSEVQLTRSRRARCKRPHFFDSLEYGNSLRKKSRLSSAVVTGKVNKKKTDQTESISGKSNKDISELSSLSSASTPSHSTDGFTSCSAASTVSEIRLRNSQLSSSSSSILRDDSSNENPLLLSIILAEINRKYVSVSFRPK